MDCSLSPTLPRQLLCQRNRGKKSKRPALEVRLLPPAAPTTATVEPLGSFPRRSRTATRVKMVRRMETMTKTIEEAHLLSFLSNGPARLKPRTFPTFRPLDGDVPQSPRLVAGLALQWMTIVPRAQRPARMVAHLIGTTRGATTVIPVPTMELTVLIWDGAALPAATSGLQRPKRDARHPANHLFYLYTNSHPDHHHTLRPWTLLHTTPHPYYATTPIWITATLPLHEPQNSRPLHSFSRFVRRFPEHQPPLPVLSKNKVSPVFVPPPRFAKPRQSHFGFSFLLLLDRYRCHYVSYSSCCRSFLFFLFFPYVLRTRGLSLFVFLTFSVATFYAEIGGCCDIIDENYPFFGFSPSSLLRE